MAIIWSEGFDNYPVGTNTWYPTATYSSKWTGGAAFSNGWLRPVVSNRFSPSKGNSLYIIHAQANNFYTYLYADFPSLIAINAMPAGTGQYSSLIFGFAYNPGNFNQPAFIMSFHDGTTNLCHLRYINSSGILHFTQGSTGTTILNTNGFVTPNTWCYIEIKITFSNTTAGSIEMRLNGSTVANETGIRTSWGQNYCSRIYIGDAVNVSNGGSDMGTYYDDMYLIDPTVAPHQDFLGPVIVKGLIPNADAQQQWSTSTGTAHYALLDETQNNPVDYIAATTSGLKDILNLPDITETPSTIYGVNVMTAGYKTSLEIPLNYAQSVIVNGNETSTTIPTDFSRYPVQKIYTTNPDPASGGVWNQTAINNLQIGITSEST